MKRFVAPLLALSMAGCAPSYVWGDADRIEERLVQMVPLGSTPAQLQQAARERGWDIDHRNIRSWPVGTETYMHDTHLDCRSRGGADVGVIIARYSAPFQTAVESLWLFDSQLRLQDVCVRKTVDAF